MEGEECGLGAVKESEGERRRKRKGGRWNAVLPAFVRHGGNHCRTATSSATASRMGRTAGRDSTLVGEVRKGPKHIS